jgi:HAD superfamily hydrolase (TIGR01490 family)
MHLALFDLDNTLIRGDCEVLWSRYLDRLGVYDMLGVERFAEEYAAGTLDFDRFMDFMLAPLAATPLPRLESLRGDFLASEIEPLLSSAGIERIEEHRALGHSLLAVSAAHDFLAAPIARACGLEEGLFTLAERKSTGYTGRVIGRPCFREGKVEHLASWLKDSGNSWSDVSESWFYSDSHNDLPLLEKVHSPVAVGPDPRLRTHATKRGWEIIDTW